MKKYLYLISIILLNACTTNSTGKNEMDILSTNNHSNITDLEDKNDEEEMIFDEYSDYATFFVIIADTSFDYYFLHKKMFDLNKKLNMPIDTLGRLYNEFENLISLPDDDEDEIYAGEYFPRRFPSENLSLEYLEYYQNQTNEKTIALVTGIYQTEKSADSALTILQKTEKKAFKLEANIYVGCMH